jgi:high-affinity iron transporter
MGQMLVITLREGIEAFLIVAIAAAYLRKTGRSALLPAVWWGSALAVVLSIALGAFLAEFAVLPLYEGLLAAVAAVLVLSMVVYMLKAAKRLRADIARRLETAATRPGPAAWIGVFGFVVLMMTREGMEMAFITASLIRQVEAAALLPGAVAGAALAALLAAAWARWGHRVNLGLFLQVTAIFLALFAVQLLVYAFHEFTEANVLPGVDNAYWHVATEELAEGVYAQVYSAVLVFLPLGWLVWRKRRMQRARA